MNTLTSTGEAPFSPKGAGKQCYTWYRIFGELSKSTHRPLVVVHGGPGIDHQYLLTLSDLTYAYSIPVILYDQLGIGLSTHLPEKIGDQQFWTVDLFVEELVNLLKHLKIEDDYDLLGHSWGGIVAGCYAIRQPPGLKNLILSSSIPDTNLWLQAQWEIREQLPHSIQEVLKRHEDNNTRGELEYQIAMSAYVSRCVCRLNPLPREFTASYSWFTKDPTVVASMYGPGQWEVTGSLKNWSILDQIHKINVPTLLINGRYDQAQDPVVLPYFRAIQKVKWVTFAESAHMVHLEERERHLEVVGDFLVD